jgi:hypothetical protein
MNKERSGNEGLVSWRSMGGGGEMIYPRSVVEQGKKEACSEGRVCLALDIAENWNGGGGGVQPHGPLQIA